ncbi:MAG: phosphoenolpyruvate synthase, partial [archaeon]
MVIKKEVIEHPDFVKWFSELDKNSGKIAGGKGANLAEIFNLKIPVPPGFVITAQAYDYFIEKAGINEQIKKLMKSIDYEDTKQLEEVAKEIRESIINSKFPKELEEEVTEAYDSLDTSNLNMESDIVSSILKNSSEPVFVAVRSSATTEDLAEASFAGQQESFLNVKGKSELIENIKKCFASLFTARAVYYRNKKGFKEASLAVVVQRMIDSDKSGVIFSKNPSYDDDENIIIESVFGLGEGIVLGIITPDKYIISPELEILKKDISEKKVAITRNSSGAQEKVKLTSEKSSSQVLKDHEIKRLADLAIRIEEHYGKPQDLEFAIENNEIFIVQTRPITTIKGRLKKGDEKQIQGKEILKGLAASPGIASGTVKIVKTLEDLQKIKTGDILVTKMTSPDMVVTMQKSAAIITDEGGLTAHAAIVSREMGIACVVGTQEATKILKEGDIVTVDGFNGKIYSGKTSETIIQEIKPIETKTKTKIKVMVDLPTFAERSAKTGIKQIGLTRIEGIISESGKHPNYFLKQNKIKDYEEIIYKGLSEIAKYFEEIWVRTSDIRSDEFGHLEGAPKEVEANPMLGMHGIRFGLKYPEILKAELRALKRVSEHGKKIGILLPQVISVEEVRKTKEIIKSLEFGQAKLGIMVETPAAVQLIRELCQEKIKFISFGTNDLTQYILAVDRGNEQVQELYNEMHPAVLHQLAYVIRVCKREGVESSICGQAGSKKEMVKFLVENGIDSISVNADSANEIA